MGTLRQHWEELKMEQFGRSSEDNKELPYNSAVPLAHRDTSNIPTLEATKVCQLNG